jgi:hypothetical protein
VEQSDDFTDEDLGTGPVASQHRDVVNSGGPHQFLETPKRYRFVSNEVTFLPTGFRIDWPADWLALPDSTIAQVRWEAFRR